MINPNAVTVCVNYYDFLRNTIFFNRNFFNRYIVVTSTKGEHEELSKLKELSLRYDLELVVTDSFYQNKAYFNKWIALEEGLDLIRNDWICILDSDIVIPGNAKFEFKEGNLYTPLRYMMEDFKVSSNKDNQLDPNILVWNDETQWRHLPIHPNLNEFAGYFQCFHGQDTRLGKPPWHETNWIHAGGADSFFQLKWLNTNKIRPDFKVLHLGKSGVNWFGRRQPYLDGTIPEKSNELEKIHNEIFQKRRTNRNKGDRFKDEKIN